MKFFATAVVAFAVGAFAGIAFGGYVLVGFLHRGVAASNADNRLRIAVSLRALDDLQAGHVDQAKSFLAGQVAIYYHSMQQLDASPEKQRLLQHIEASSEKSAELKEALDKKPQ